MRRRRAQHSVWGWAAGITVAFGLGCAVALWGIWGPVATMFGTFIPASVAAVLVGKSAWVSCRIGLKFAVVCLAGAGLLVACGWSGALLIGLVAVTSPAVRMVLATGQLKAVMGQGGSGAGAGVLENGGRFDSWTETGADGALLELVPPAEMPSAERVASLDDCALCQVWRRSYVRLETSRASADRLEVVLLREAYLDELVRRHPDQVRQWLASGARAAGNPLPFLSQPVSHEAPSEEQADGEGPEAA